MSQVIEELRKYQQFVNAKKNEFSLQDIHYLDHIVFHNQVRMDPEKIKAIVDWPKPAYVHDVRRILGLCSY